MGTFEIIIIAVIAIVLYIMASLVTLFIAQYGVKTIDTLIATLKMKNIRVKERILTIVLIVKDVIVLLFQCLIATILTSVCIENGWILFNDIIDVSNAMFWKIYSAFFVLIPLIMFYRGITGKYLVEIKKIQI